METTKDFSRYGRVDYVLSQRMELLSEVRRLAGTLPDVTADVGYTCETAGHFYQYHVQPRWQKYFTEVRLPENEEPTAEHIAAVAAKFPFADFFANAPGRLFGGKSYAVDLDAAEGCQRHMDNIFEQLRGFRAFELLHKGRDRSKYLLVKEAKIVAMTCTHAALARRQLTKLGFKCVMLERRWAIFLVAHPAPLCLLLACF